MRRRYLLGLAAAAALAAACGQAPLPTSPSATGVGAPGRLFAGSDDVSSALDVRALAGQVIDLLTGGPAAGVVVSVEGVGEAAADGAGAFALESEAADGQYRATLSGAGFVSRQTSLMFPGQPPVLSLIPSGFNMTAFDQLVRQFGEPFGTLKRWTQPPALLIETSLVDPQSVIDGVPQYPAVASADQLSEEDINELVGQLANALPQITAGNFPGFLSIDRSTTEAGAPIEMDRPGVITVVKYQGLDSLCRGYTYFLYDNLTLQAMSSRLFLQTCTAGAGARPPSFIVTHELGHALGYGHVTGLSSVMTAVVDTDVTEFDRQAATITFQRVPGNQAPDVDPDVAVNPARRFGGRARVAGPIQ